MIMPPDIIDGAVKIGFIPSDTKKDRVVMVIKLDYGLTDMSPTEAANTGKTIVGLLRSLFRIRLSEFR